MLNEKEYIEYRKNFTNQITPEIIYEYYLEHNNETRNLINYQNRLKMDQGTFEHCFSKFINNMSGPSKDNIIGTIITYFDKKFGINTLYDKDGKLIKIL